MNKEITSMISAVITTLNKDGTFDKPGMRRLVRHNIEGGIRTLFPLGYAGEVLAFNRRVRREILETVIEEAGSGITIIAGVFENSTELVLDYIADAKACGADYVLCPSPNFYPLTQDELKDFFYTIADKGGMPVIPYNNPQNNRNYLKPELIYELSKNPMIPALKNSSNAEDIQKAILAAGTDSADFKLLSGDEFAFQMSLGLGVKGFVMGGPANMFPAKCVSVVNNYNNGLFDKVRNDYLEMIAFLYELYFFGPVDIAACKAVLEHMGVCSRWVAHPLRSATDEEMVRLKTMMNRYAGVFIP
jgi:4-hydroxy-tetrahydrodipicolinate synthase